MSMYILLFLAFGVGHVTAFAIRECCHERYLRTKLKARDVLLHDYRNRLWAARERELYLRTELRKALNAPGGAHRVGFIGDDRGESGL